MSWRPDLVGGCEAAKVAPLVVPYLQGRCLDIGSGPGKVWPSLIGIDTATQGGRPVTDMHMDGTKELPFTAATMDGVFSSFLLHQIEPSRVPHVLREWARVLKVGGYLVLYLPDAETMPPEADPLGKWRPTLKDIQSNLPDADWELIEAERRIEGDEYGMLIVLRKSAAGWSENLWQRNPDGKKRALVIRYGAIGDAVVAASILPGLQKQGYHVTFNCREAIRDVLRHDPHIDDWLIQETDFVPNDMLGPYWHALSERYDRIVNLSESVEGLLLALPGRLNHAYSDEARRAIYGHVNYWEHTHNIAAVPHEFNARFYPTEAEHKWAAAVRRTMAGPVVAWVVNGSSPHKVYPWVQVVASWLLERTPAHIVLYADAGVGKQLQDGIMACLKEAGHDMARVHGIAGKWSIRQSLTFAQHADCVVGPETGPMNGVGMEVVPKVIYLSHSSPDNLTKHWVNTTVLTPDLARAPCYPCHRLHHGWEFCPRDEQTAAATCASAIAPSVVFEAIGLAIGARKAA